MKSDSVRSAMEARVSEILFYVWDPIGVNRMTSCRGEYEQYVPIISAYLLDDFKEAGVDALMMFIMEEYIGVCLSKVPRRKFQHLEAIRMLKEWKKDFFSTHPDVISAAPNFPKYKSFLDQINWSRQQYLTCERPKYSLAGASMTK